MASPTQEFQDGQAARDGNEERFLAYVASRIDRAVDLFQHGKRQEAQTCAEILQLAKLALEVHGSSDEVEAWLKTATRATEFTWGRLFSRSEGFET
jgi:uncharacterized protein (DUF2384 family)